MTKEERKEYNKKWQQANKEQVKINKAEYYQSNKARLSEHHGKYYETNKSRITSQISKYQKQKKVTDPAFKLICNLRSRHWKMLKGITSTTKGLGCDSHFLREHLEKQWTEGMNWDNYGTKEGQWSLDHILPLTLYYTQPALLPQLIHYSNMQPMWHVENIKKGKKVA